ncbi:iron-uptake factor [Stenotrophomonas maltophilia]|uniref:PepSY domain-containing protein n=1 Tax=Stenotrophomonas maltophilia TaxID=40324 RepID=UPI0015DF823D|nr:sulfite reductase flavoprotein subunit alpha [Stenotrophomonas maltophilia]MBA0435511.1 iron-uptake factor [Stenotrophomonas maltophilia]MDZ5816088.1 sulfite reductase flavoprotein subunit alpha [Stenotrophomonas maltophilia]
MFKNILFQVHWLLGITAGAILAVMGLSGAVLSFEDELLRAANPGFAAIAEHHADSQLPLTLSELVPRLQAGSERPLQRLRVDATGQRPSVARFAGGKEHWVYFDPYSGERFSALRGQAFFDFVEDLHRHLAAGERGKWITGSCAIALLFFTLSGLYLRWPRRWWHWRSWLAVEWKRSGRGFLWSLHSVVGTWVLLIYLMSALTGLWWSFDWYRSAANSVLGVAPAAKHTVAIDAPLDLQRVEATLYALPGVRTGFIDLRLPEKPGQALNVRVMAGDPSQRGGHHDRAHDLLQLDPASGAVLDSRPYDRQGAGGQLATSVFALHSGSYFGLPGRVVVMLSSLGMSLFFITGWMLYLDRRRSQRAARGLRQSLPMPAATEGHGAPWLVVHASQSGLAEQLAWRAAAKLQAAGYAVQVLPLSRIDAAKLQATSQALLVLSTFGDGEPPDAARRAARLLLAQAPDLSGLQFGLLALGDRQYPHYCGFGRQVDGWLTGNGARALFARIDVDAASVPALRQWQLQLGALTGIATDDSVLPPATRMHDWRLLGRDRLNPGSIGGAIWRIRLAAPADVQWQAGDILHIAPRHNARHAGAVLKAHGLDPLQPLLVDGAPRTLLALASERELPDADAALPVQDACLWLSGLPMLPGREYSIASAANDGEVELVVRLVHDAAGRAGLGSGWLSLHAPIGASVVARVHRNPGFHRVPAAPMVLVGNGTGIAGLRSLLRESAHAREHGHWLLFGERQRAHDLLFADEIEAWQAQGHLARVDLAFSRDGGGGYVQDRLHAAADVLRDWMQRGAVIHVCGSLQGMAEGVDQVLRAALGDDAVETLLENGRYRRDVY